MTFISSNPNYRYGCPHTYPYPYTINETPYNPLNSIKSVCDHLLNETYHVFQYKNDKYDKDITDAYNYIIDEIFKNYEYTHKYNNGIKIFNNNDTKYTLGILTHILPNIDIVQLYIGISDSAGDYGDALYINYDGCKLVRYDNDVTYFKGNDRHIQICTIVITLPELLTKTQYLNNNLFISIIRHELLHIYHGIKNSNLAIANGNAYYYADEITKAQGKKHGIYGSYDLRELLSKKELKTSDICLIFACGIYYLDNSEISAWQESFNSYDKHFICVRSKELERREPYRIYSRLLELFQLYKKDLYNIMNICDANTFELIKAYKDECNIKSIKYLVDSWIDKSKKFLVKCEKIHERNYATKKD
jgi:hypothetical protein